MKTITIAKGDGIGPEIMEATLQILKASGVQLKFEEIEVGKEAYLAGFTSGISPAAWKCIRKNKVLLKAPITTPQGKGYKSLNVTLRKTLGLYANIRPCKSLHPYVETKHPIMDLVIVRENEEDLYAGIEHQQTNDVVQCLKLISVPGCEKIIRYAFEYAKANNRKKVTCFTKDNIMKQTDGLFHQMFTEIAKEYPSLKSEHWIVDIGAAKVAETPEDFDVIVMPNLYGDIISDIAAQITGSVGLAGSSNIGENCAMFEAIHGSAPDIAGQNMANPTGLLQGAILMLKHIGEGKAAEQIHNAWTKTIEEGKHTADIYKAGTSKEKLGTKEFAEAIIENLGKVPAFLPIVNYSKNTSFDVPKASQVAPKKKELVGIDVFTDADVNPNKMAELLKKAENQLKLVMITNRGVKVWPQGFEETFCTQHWRCRFMKDNEAVVNREEIIELLRQLNNHTIDVIKTENLYTFEGKRGFSLGQGQ